MGDDDGDDFVSFAAKRAFDWIKSSINQSINQSRRTFLYYARNAGRGFVLFHSNNRIGSDSVDSVVFYYGLIPAWWRYPHLSPQLHPRGVLKKAQTPL